MPASTGLRQKSSQAETRATFEQYRNGRGNADSHQKNLRQALTVALSLPTMGALLGIIRYYGLAVLALLHLNLRK